MSKFLLDSCILIDHFNGVDAATEFIGRNQKELALSVITRAEVLVGISKNNESMAKSFLDHFKTLQISVEDADLAANLRRQENWKLPDALQAAIALNHALKLVTRNTKDFSPKKHAFVYVPYNFSCLSEKRT